MSLTKALAIVMGFGLSINYCGLANATKCLKAKTLSELKEAFPVVIKGKIIKRWPSEDTQGAFRLKIDVISVLKGQFDSTNIEAIEEHLGNKYAVKHAYEVGTDHVFALAKEKAGYHVVLPTDGCPELPSE